MKTSIAAFVVAVEEFLAATPDPLLHIAFLLTSDEEGPSVDGTKVVVEQLRAQGERLDYCIVGEPTAVHKTGDMIKNGRRGTLSGKLTVRGIQGHVAYPEKARNPIHQAMPALAELSARRWDEGYPEFPASSFQISNIHAGTGANNVIPGQCEVVFNFRYNPGWRAEALEAEVHSLLDRHGLEYELRWHRGGEPFLTGEGRLRAAVRAVLVDMFGMAPEENTGGGTSDARFIAPLGAEVVELGPVNASIHKVDEHIALADLERLPALYRAVAERLLLA
jgi:succinyl-diaminopimelate desuccinylase